MTTLTSRFRIPLVFLMTFMFIFMVNLNVQLTTTQSSNHIQRDLSQEKLIVNDSDDHLKDSVNDKNEQLISDVDFLRPPEPPPISKSNGGGGGAGIWDMAKELMNVVSAMRTEGSVLNIKPIVNMTINAFGWFNEDDRNKNSHEINAQTVLKSMFQMWSPEASAWASKISREYKNYVREVGEFGDMGYQSKHKKKIVTWLEPCSCKRTLLVETERRGPEKMSTCSKETYLRGPGQKVIGFSFYGNPNSTKGKERKYFQGIAENLALLPKHYPDWIIRVYYDLEPGNPILNNLCDLACNNPSLDLCYVKSIPSSGDISRIFAMIWRFFPVLDPQVDAFLSRDLDSRLNSREAAAVSAWLSTPKHFHFMRDHPAHTIEILGSGWGTRLGPEYSKVRKVFMEAFQQASNDVIFWASRISYGPDQRFPRTSAFPTKRKEGENNFVASVVESRGILRNECPVACRPPDHKDWIRC